MSKNRPEAGAPSSEIDEYVALGEFWDTHSLADYWEESEPAQLEFAPLLGRRILVPVDPELLLRVRRMAQTRGLSTESLVNLLLEQRMQQLSTTDALAV